MVEGTGKWWTFSSLCRAPGFAITFMENPLVGLLGGMELVSEQTTLQIRLLVQLPKSHFGSTTFEIISVKLKI